MKHFRMQNNKNYFKLVLIVISFIYIGVVLGFATISYRIIALDTQKELGKQAMILAIDIAERMELSKSEFDRLLSLEYEDLLNDPTNIEFENKARAVMKYSNIKYIYLEALISDDKVKYQVEQGESDHYGKTVGTQMNVVYLLDAVINEQTRWEDTDGKWYVDKHRYTVLLDPDKNAFKDQSPTSFISSDEWGSYITGFAPYYDNDGDFMGLIGVDLFLDQYLAHLRMNLLILGGFVITLTVIGVFAIYLTLRVKRVEDLVEEKSELSNIDALTSLANRRHFWEIMEERWADSMRKKEPISLLIIDIDFFKEYNDNYGHLAGDEVLHRVAQVIKQNVRQNYDYVGRYGGDEFVVLINNTDCSMAQKVAANLVEKINGLQIEHNDSPSRYVTITIGLAAMVPEPETTLEELFRRADNALYAGKEQGKNRVLVWNEFIPGKSHRPLST